VHPAFFETPDAFRAWLAEHHASAAELLVGFYKKGTGRPSITWPQSVDEALCFGWIDGIRKGLDEESCTIRFTPRGPRSNWSAVNIGRAKELIELGRMRPAAGWSDRLFRGDLGAANGWMVFPVGLSRPNVGTGGSCSAGGRQTML
jgi:hypothetical protein